MGNVTGAQRKHVVDDADPTTWHLERVEAIRTRYLAGNYDFGVEKEQLREIVQPVLLDEGCDTLDLVLWPRFAEYNSGSEANMLEVLGGLAVISRGTFEAKVEFAFRVFDFNDQGSLSHDEVCVMLLTMLSGTVLVTRRGNLPEDADLETHADHAFLRCGKDLTMRVDFVDLMTWFRSHIKELCEDRGFALCDSPEAFLRCFDLVGASMLKKKSKGDRW
ncbi:hypothetical protein AURANDRAFT_67469 [Aureococcus anophagefferens]|uniref:EF-hand domain-containing protein n=1 Tax=Aureococcus anophagefferens TaxID=44056 RepID=F0YL96_AURAN|nr:hypothetical protein AURANDRAFT_67469 [Aureococcus anophagefferens]EGB04058.1 hypothetical protein AURANDRAFT_67469 [Aureococcus anophagefferens]|eukprot:XP_009041183.1 hypothetical protein AURANDRAFT_67469 [Aureococcus anophagefferens]